MAWRRARAVTRTAPRRRAGAANPARLRRRRRQARCSWHPPPCRTRSDRRRDRGATARWRRHCRVSPGSRIARSTDTGAEASLSILRLVRHFWTCRQEALDFNEIAGNDGRINAVGRNLRILGEQALRGAIVHAVIALAVHVMVPARELQESPHALGVAAVGVLSRAPARTVCPLRHQHLGAGHLLLLHGIDERCHLAAPRPVGVRLTEPPVLAEWTRQGLGIALQNSGNAVREIEVDRLEHIDLALRESDRERPHARHSPPTPQALRSTCRRGSRGRHRGRREPRQHRRCHSMPAAWSAV